MQYADPLSDKKPVTPAPRKKSRNKGRAKKKKRDKPAGWVSSMPVEPAPRTAPEQKDPQDKAQKYSGFPRTDAGNAELFAALYEKLLRYDHKRKRWLKWAQHWWVEDETSVVHQFV